jgi:hypothetical protein
MGRLITLLAFVTCALGAIETPQKTTERPSRAQFARAMASIKEGMTAPEIREILGKPDDIRTGRGDRGGGRPYYEALRLLAARLAALRDATAEIDRGIPLG